MLSTAPSNFRLVVSNTSELVTRPSSMPSKTESSASDRILPRSRPAPVTAPVRPSANARGSELATTNTARIFRDSSAVLGFGGGEARKQSFLTRNAGTKPVAALDGIADFATCHYWDNAPVIFCCGVGIIGVKIIRKHLWAPMLPCRVPRSLVAKTVKTCLIRMLVLVRLQNQSASLPESTD
jgi:hypothetical protein